MIQEIATFLYLEGPSNDIYQAEFNQINSSRQRGLVYLLWIYELLKETRNRPWSDYRLLSIIDWARWLAKCHSLNMMRKLFLGLEKLKNIPRVETVNTTCFLRNFLVTKSGLENQTGVEVIQEKRPKLKFLRVLKIRV